MKSTKRRDVATKRKSASASESPALDYSAWKQKARKILQDKHGVTAPMIRERVWRDAYVTGAPPDAGAEIAWRNSWNALPLAERTRKR